MVMVSTRKSRRRVTAPPALMPTMAALGKSCAEGRGGEGRGGNYMKTYTLDNLD